MTVTPAILRASLLSDATKGATLRRWSIRDLLSLNPTRDGRSERDADVVESLLREVQIRLAVQHSKLSSFSTSIGGAGRSGDDDDDDDERARACLGSLMQLHESTHLLPHRIVDGDWRGLLEDYTKPNRRYVTGVFDEVMSRHGSSVETLADAVMHARRGAEKRRGGEVPEFPRNESIESFLHSRLLIQLLCEHHVSLVKGRPTGAISLGADVAGAINDAAAEARHVCDANLGVAPDVVVVARPGDGGGAGRDDFRPPPIVRSWLHHAIVEVTKNAMASTVRGYYRSTRSGGSTPPPGVHISFGAETTTGGRSTDGRSTDGSDRYLRIRITDRGIGLEDSEQAFGFARSSSPK